MQQQEKPEDDEFFRWLAAINMKFLQNRGITATTWGVADNCALFGSLVSPQRVGEETRRKPELFADRMTIFLDFMARLEAFSKTMVK